MFINKTSIINAIASLFAFCMYTIFLIVFVIFDSSDFGRTSLQSLDLSYIILLIFYLSLYTGIFSALARNGSITLRICGGFGAALVNATGGLIALGTGFGLLAAFFWLPQLVFVIAPLTGAAVGIFGNFSITTFADWRMTNSIFSMLKRHNVFVSVVSTSLTGYFAFSHGMGHHGPVALGRVRVFDEIVAGLLGPLLHVVVASGSMISHRADTMPSKLSRESVGAMGGMIAIILIGLGIAISATSIKSGGRLWTISGLTDVLASEEDVRQRRSPAVDQPIRIGKYIINILPKNLVNGLYNWQERKYHDATLNLGDLEISGKIISVQINLTTTHQLGLGYLCGEPSEGVLVACRVAEFDRSSDQSDPRVIRAGLYQGDAELGEAGRRFLISCRYSFKSCKIEFIDDWHPGLRISLILNETDRAYWNTIVRSAQSKIENIVKPAP